MSNHELLGTSIIAFSRSQKGGKVFHASNPATGKDLEQPFHSATHEDLERAASMAERAFLPYSALPAAARAAFLQAIAAEIEATGDPLVARVMAESGLPEARVRSERARTCFQLRFFAGILEEGSWIDARIDTADPSRKPSPNPEVRSMMRPLGPVAVFGASNFPLAYSAAGGDTASALAAGSPVVAIAHYSHPGSAEIMGAAIQRAAQALGMPDGVYSLLFAAKSEQQVGAELVRHPAIAAVGFTGSRAGGTALLRLAQARPTPIPFYAEMSSVNPVIILPHAMRARGEQIVAGLHTSITVNAGQFCTNPGLVLLGADQPADDFASALAARMSATPSTVMLNQTIKDAYAAGTSKRGKAAGVRQLAVGDGESATALFEVDAAAFVADPSLQDEIFGPSSLLIRANSREQMLQAVDSLEGNLTATVHMEEADLADAKILLQRLEKKAGRIVFNGYPTGVEVAQAMVHGGPWPSTSDSRTTSVGGRAMLRFVRPVCYQDAPAEMLPVELRDGNPSGILRIVNGKYAR
ncbi:MAG: aldehyde dehydrogenase (NADP(+)) [Acidobacteriaceae bacterium]